MRCTCRWMFWGLLWAAPALLAQSAPDQTAAPDPASATTPPSNSHKVQKQAVPLPQMPSGPLSQLPMDQIPPTPAKVTFQDGLLTISAQNSTLGEILREVHKLTGASIDIPASGANERVVTHLGPGAPRDVLAVLLNGSSFNYVMVGSNSDPTAVSSVILSSKPSSSPETPAQTQTAANVYQNSPQPVPAPPQRFAGRGPFNQQVVPQPGNTPPASADADDSKDDEELSADDQPDDQQQPGQPAQPDGTDATVPAQPQQPDPNQPNAGPKTPEQILEMLRKQQQPGSIPPQPQPPQQPPQQ